MNNIVNIIINTLRLHRHHIKTITISIINIIYIFWYIYLFILWKNARRYVSKLPVTHFRNGEEVGGGTEKRANIREVT